jgi:hypothetical protein
LLRSSELDTERESNQGAHSWLSWTLAHQMKEEKINGGINMIEIGKLLQVDETDSRETGEVELRVMLRCAVSPQKKTQYRMHMSSQP